MAQQSNNDNSSAPKPTYKFIVRVLLKTAILFGLCNVIFALTSPMQWLGAVSVYGSIVQARDRLPYGENPSEAYNLSLNNIPAMFASHAIAQPKQAQEFRMMIIGDSANWGILLKPEETLAGFINSQNVTLADGRTIIAYNLGHPIMSLTKDLLILQEALQYQPDMVIWLTTLQSFPRDKQLFPPIVHENPEQVRALIETYQLDIELANAGLDKPTLWSRTIIGQRRALADWLRLQLYGVMWTVTNIDQSYPDEFELRSSDFAEDSSWLNLSEAQELTETELAFDTIRAGQAMVGTVPLLLINEPIFMSDGENSDLRYNFWYPRWAYDSYRELFAEIATAEDWHYVDAWDRIAPAEFTDSPVHLTPQGSAQLAQFVTGAILQIVETN